MNPDADLLLARLRAEREKFSRSDQEQMRYLCERLIELGVYPETSKIGLSALQMVDNWGVYWYEWQKPHFCPQCGADIRDHRNGPPFKREIGQVINDRCDSYLCPDCNCLFDCNGEKLN